MGLSRRHALWVATAASATNRLSRNYLLMHGARHGAWAWQRVAPMLTWAQARIALQATLRFVKEVKGAPFADGRVWLDCLKCRRNPNPGFKNIAAAVPRDPRVRYAEVDGHHSANVIRSERQTESLLHLD